MKPDFQKRLNKEYGVNRPTEYFFSLVYFIAGAYFLQGTFDAKLESTGTWVMRFMAFLFLAAGASGLYAIPRRYKLQFLSSTSGVRLKRQYLNLIAKSKRTLRVHLSPDNAVIDLEGRWWRMYRVRIFFNDEGYYIHSTLIHNSYISPIHFGLSRKQTDRTVAVIKSIDPEA